MRVRFPPQAFQLKLVSRMTFWPHAGFALLADGSDDADEYLKRTLWNDPATGVMRHADAGYQTAIDCARRQGLNLPMID